MTDHKGRRGGAQIKTAGHLLPGTDTDKGTGTHIESRCKKRRGNLTPMTPAAEGMSFNTGFIRMTALP